jgi:hypothetical protein
MAEQVDVCNTRAERTCSARPPTAGLCQFRKSLDLLDNLSSATASTPGGMVRPRALAILILMIISLAVCTEKLNPDVVAMKSAKDRI